MSLLDFFVPNRNKAPIKMAVPKNDALSIPVGIQGGRQSEPETVSLLTALKGELAKIEPDFELDLIRVIEHLAKFNSEVSYAVDNVVQLANTPYVLHFGDTVSEALAKEMSLVAKLNDAAVYGGGLNSLINDLLAQVAITGAISAEAIPTKRLDDIQKIVLVNTGSIKFLYDAEKFEYMPHQKVNKSLAAVAGFGEQLKPLNPATYKYYALRRFGEKPYAIPPLMSALESITIEKDMIQGLRSIVKKLGVFGFMSVLVNPPTKKSGIGGVAPETDEQFQTRATNYLKQIRKEAEKGFDSGLAIGFKNTHEFEMQDTTMNVTGARELFNLVSEFKMAGLKQDPLMLGRNFNVAETMARVILAKLTTQIKNYQASVANFLQDYFSLKLLLKGYSQVGNLKVEFEPAMVSDKEKEENAYKIKIENQNSLYQQGVITQQQRAVALGFEKPAEEAPKPLPGYDENGAPLPAPGKSDPTATAPKKAVKTSNDNLLKEALQGKAFMLGVNVPEFKYSTCEQHAKVTIEHFNTGDKLEKYLNKYFGKAKAVYSVATRKIARKVAASLVELGEGAPVDTIIDRVLYTLFKNWTIFTIPMQKVVRKNVTTAYKAFRKDTSVFPNDGTNVPKGTFGLRDTRTIEYFKKSDNLYLGKFITDEDTKKRITEFIKEKYLQDALPIGKEGPVLADFKKQFAGVLQDQDWKIVQVLSTTVNKMRNYAAVNYMQQAGVESFEIRGIPDRLQCEICKAMQGRKFTINKALNHLDAVVSSSPEYVSSVTPFATAVFKGAQGLDELKTLSDDQIQARGIDLPSYHPSCRDRIVASI